MTSPPGDAQVASPVRANNGPITKKDALRAATKSVGGELDSIDGVCI